MINVYRMPSESHAPGAYNDFLHDRGTPTVLHQDNYRVQTGLKFRELNRTYLVANEYTEPYHPQQNPAEMRVIKWIKMHTKTLLDRTGANPNLWLHAAKYLADIHNVIADESI